MGRFNTYQSDLKYIPQTFEKLAMLPMQLRKEQDAAENDGNLINLGINDTKVASGYQDAYNSEKSVFNNKIKDLSSRLAKEGAGNIELMNEFKAVKRQYNNAASATGVFGAGAKRFKEEAEAEKMYTQYGVEKAGQGYEIVAEQWKDKMRKENDVIRQGLAKDSSFVAPEMVHEYAPNRFDLGDFALKMKGIIGMDTRNESKDLVAGLLSDGSINTHSEAYKRNKNQLTAFAELAKSNLFDSSSDLNKHFRYNKKNLKDYLGDIGNFKGMMNIDEYSESDKINPTSSGTNTTNTTDPPKEGVLIEERTNRSPDLEVKLPGFNQGEAFDMSGANTARIKRHMERLENANNPVIHTQNYGNQKQAVIDLDDNVRKWDLANNDLMEEAFKKSDYYSKDKKLATFEGVNMASSYGEFIKRNEEFKQKTIVSLQNSGYSAEKISEIVNKNEDYLDEVKQNLRTETKVSDLMFKQNVYGFGFNEASAKLVESSVAYLKSNAQFFKDQAGSNSFAYETNAQGEEVPTTVEGLNASTASDIRITSIATKNGKGVPSIGIELTYKKSENGPASTKRLDLEVLDKDGNIGRETIKVMLKQATDDKTKYVLQSILDSASANQIIPDSTEYSGTATARRGASQPQSDMIVAFSAPYRKGKTNSTINKEGSYQILSQGAHYAFKVKQKGESDYHVYNVDDLLNDRVPQGNSTTDLYKQQAKNKEIAAMYTLLGYDPALGVESFTSTNNPLMPEDSGSKRNMLSLALTEYASVFNSAEATMLERNEATNKLATKIGKIGIKSMNKAAFLKS